MFPMQQKLGHKEKEIRDRHKASLFTPPSAVDVMESVPSVHLSVFENALKGIFLPSMSAFEMIDS